MGGNNFVEWQFPQAINIRLVETQFGEQEFRAALGCFSRTEAQARPAVYNSGLKQTFGSRHGEQGGYLATTTGFTKDHHPLRITAKGGNVVADPLQRLHQIQHAGVAGAGVTLTANG